MMGGCRRICSARRPSDSGLLAWRALPATPLEFFSSKSLRRSWCQVLDFGLVKGQGSEQPTEAGLTAPNTVTGTPSFLSPETALGKPVDRRTDLYSLGCVAYWMLTARLVFDAESALPMIFHHV